MRSEELECGCVVEHYEHDFFSSSRHSYKSKFCDVCLAKEKEEKERWDRERELREQIEKEKKERLDRQRELKKQTFEQHVEELKEIKPSETPRAPIKEAIAKYRSYKPQLSNSDNWIRKRVLLAEPIFELLCFAKIKGRWHCDAAKLEHVDFSLFDR